MKKKHVLVLGGSSDIGIEVIKMFLKLNWSVSAHYFKNKTKLNLLKKKSKNLNLVKLDFSKTNPKIEILIKKNFKDKEKFFFYNFTFMLIYNIYKNFLIILFFNSININNKIKIL